MFLPKTAGPDLYQLGEFFAVVASLLHLLRLFGHLDRFSTILFSVFLLNYFF